MRLTRTGNPPTPPSPPWPVDREFQCPRCDCRFETAEDDEARGAITLGRVFLTGKRTMACICPGCGASLRYVDGHELPTVWPRPLYAPTRKT